MNNRIDKESAQTRGERMQKSITRERIQQAEEQLLECIKNKEYPELWFEAQKWYLIHILMNKLEERKDTITFIVVSDVEIVEQAAVKKIIVPIADSGTIERYFDQIRYTLKGPALHLAFILEEYIDACKVSVGLANDWLERIKDKEKVAQAKDILENGGKYLAASRLDGQIVKRETREKEVTVTKFGEIYSVIEAYGVRFGWYEAKKKTFSFARWVETTDLHEGAWYIR